LTGTALPLRFVFTLLKWIAVFAALGVVLLLVFLLHNRSGEMQADVSAENPRRVQNNVVKLGAALAESYGLKDALAEPARWHQNLTVYGRVVPNPRATTEVRAPFAGTLRPGPKGSWPALGSRVKAGQVLARLDVRVGPEVRLDLVTRLNEARAKLAGAEEVVKIEQQRLERLKSAGASVAQADLDTARRQLTEAETARAAARATVKQWENALTEMTRQGERKDATWSQPLSAPSTGEITELGGAPGMAVEPGGLIARVVDFRRALVRLDIPLVALAAGPPRTVALSVDSAVAPAMQGASSRPDAAKPAPTFPAVLAGAVPHVETTSQSAGFWYEVDATVVSTHDSGKKKGTAAALIGGGIWRAGLFVTAQLRVLGSKPRSAVAVPETALLYHQGRALVYVRIGPGRYERRAVQVLGREGDRWLLAAGRDAGVTAGERVVHQRAQVLLSEEFRGEADND
jgi:multidrug efflux pump subunit AcrA (membrane-fusion protein)